MISGTKPWLSEGEWVHVTEILSLFYQNGEKSRNPGEFDCPPGWTWEDEWTVDDNRAVDDQGENMS